MYPLPPGVELSAFSSSAALFDAAAVHVASRLSTARAIALTGGRTARLFYGHLARYCSAVNSDGIHWFWGDDRFLPADHPDSNAGMTCQMLFSILRVGHIHPIPFSASSAEEAAETYARTLESFYGADRLQSNRPLFDLVLLVLGSDGHIASLLPNSHALNERKAWTAVVQGHDYSRVTITYPLLESTREVVLIATGEAKQAALAGWFAGDTSFPVTAFKPSSGIRLFADVAALEPTRECKSV